MRLHRFDSSTISLLNLFAFDLIYSSYSILAYCVFTTRVTVISALIYCRSAIYQRACPAPLAIVSTLFGAYLYHAPT
jgi:hypothetical protein